MMDAIYEMVGYVKYLTTLGDTFERYNSNTIGKKILLFPVLFICVILLIIITPFMIVGCLLRPIFILIDWVNDAIDNNFRYVLDSTAFLEFYGAIILLYVILWLLYLTHKGAGYVLGKTITANYDTSYDLHYTDSFTVDNKPKTNQVYVINDEDYK